jgi:hypothetical protein
VRQSAAISWPRALNIGMPQMEREHEIDALRFWMVTQPCGFSTDNALGARARDRP